MITSKQRAALKGMANTMEAIGQVGKGGIVDTLITQVDDALTARELIKFKVLETCPQDAKEIAGEIAEKTRSEVVQVIGRRFVLYRANPKKPVGERIVLNP